MKKEFDIFMEEVLDEVAKQLGEGFHAERKDTVKNNGVIRRQAVISDGMHEAAPCIWMEPYYELYKRQEDIRIIAGDIIKTCQRNGWEDFSAECFTDWEWAKDKLMFRLAGTEKNKEMLEDMPHRDIPGLGLSMAFYILLRTESGRRASIHVHNNHMKLWGVTEAELMERAEENTPREMGLSINSVMEALYGGAEGGMDGMGCSEDPIPLYVLSNKQKLYGAGCILYQGALEQAAEMIGSSFYILPSSLHEVILLPAAMQDGGNFQKLKEMVAEINRSDALSAEDVLIDGVYYYDRGKKELSAAI